MDTSTDFDLESLVHVEQSFYETGYQDGFDHGRIHGLIEGRALGREQGFAMWEELGFYEGFALTWRAILVKQSREEEHLVRARKALVILLTGSYVHFEDEHMKPVHSI
ncbi:hypothetical protein D9613_004367 [Agrocybe pediades]|uniref:Essential protein Yae1 N-terminal domain-containing protein n=1 Tax=Agrocybe pediades TaxID=84607 RepID=A0A8H4QJG9_9AGAR|nr:hypothetical protein D9613_004367 [Agrocybe pediades]